MARIPAACGVFVGYGQVVKVFSNGVNGAGLIREGVAGGLRCDGFFSFLLISFLFLLFLGSCLAWLIGQPGFIRDIIVWLLRL